MSLMIVMMFGIGHAQDPPIIYHNIHIYLGIHVGGGAGDVNPEGEGHIFREMADHIGLVDKEDLLVDGPRTRTVSS